MSIKEIRDKFSTAVERAYAWCIIICVILNLICWTLIGFGIGSLFGHAVLLGFIGSVIGLLLGYVLGDLFATSWCGFAASVIHISETNDSVAQKMETLCSLQKELLERISKVPETVSGDSESDGKKQAEVEKNQKKEDWEEKSEKIENLQNHFNYDEHKDVFEKLSTTKELLDYLESLDNKDEWFKNKVLFEVKEILLMEKIYGVNMYENALTKLKGLST